MNLFEMEQKHKKDSDSLLQVSQFKQNLEELIAALKIAAKEKDQ